MRALSLLQDIARHYQSILGEKLVGLYVHGSIAFGCFSWAKSDIDFLTVVTSPLTLPEKEALITVLLDLDAQAPAKGFEMSVVLLETCRYFQHPAPYELHYSNAHKSKCFTDLSGYCLTSHGTDSDLAAHFTVTRAVGFPIIGPNVEQIFSPVPKEAYWDSLWGDIQDGETAILKDPLYYTLNLCRVLAYHQEGLILSKEQGGQWAISHLDSPFLPLVTQALHCYQQGLSFSPSPDTAVAFVQHIKKWISSPSG